MFEGDNSELKDQLMQLEGRVNDLESGGADVSKVRLALEKLKNIPLENGVDKLTAPMKKLEGVISRLEKKKTGGRARRVAKPKKGAEPEKSEERAIEIVAPKEPEAVDPPHSDKMEFDEEACKEKIQSLKKRLRYARGKGADIKPIADHVGQLQKAINDRDQNMFDSYFEPTLSWIDELDQQQKVSGLVDIINGINDWIELLSRADPEKDLSGVVERVNVLAEGIEGFDSEGIEKATSDAESMKKELEADIEKVNEKVREGIEKRFGDIDAILNETKEEVYGPFRQELETLRATEGDPSQVDEGARDLLKRIRSEINSEGLKKLETILISVEPLIARAGSIEGKDSPTYLKLIKEKEQVITTSEEEIDKAMSMVDLLLDAAARAVAVSEENWILNLNGSISKENARAEGLRDPYIDPSPVLKILDRAKGLVDDGKLEGAQDLLNKAIAATDKLKGRKKTAQAQAQISEIEQQLSEMEAGGVDISPVREALDEVQAAMAGGEFTEMEGALAKARERVGFLRLEELKVEYQQLLIPILNDLRALKNEGKDVIELEKKFDEVKLTYTQRNFAEAVSEAGKLRAELIGIRISDILRESLDLIAQTIKEAEGVIVDVAPYRERLTAADHLMDKGKIDEALDLVTRVQVELDIELNTRVFSMLERQIRNLMTEGSSLSLPLEEVEKRISEATELTHEDKYNGALEKLASIKVELEGQLTLRRAEVQMEDLMGKIREARSIGLSIADYKTSHTKARIKLDAGDIEGAAGEVISKIPQLEGEITKRKGVLEVLDRLRGRLLAQEGKISRLISNGVSVGELPNKVNKVRENIDSLDVVTAEVGLEGLEGEIYTLIQATSTGAAPRPQSRSTIEEVERLTSLQKDLTPEEARKKLFELIPKIKKVMASSRSGGEGCKRDLEVIMKLVASRDYQRAYDTSLVCYRRAQEE
ncbi:MAG: hypothetical protein KAH57_04275 [Thermoplasmata archaeon]|nr:hypothetical protein [Thermoplasmata archaeon]